MSTGHNLIFLISQPRAGSTLLQKVLGGHSDIHTVSEPWIALHPLLALRQKGVSAYHSHALAREATADFLSQVPGGEDAYYFATRLMLNHLYDAIRTPSGKPIFLDKTPRYYFIIPELRRVFPDARFVFLLRNPLATFSSMMAAWVQSPYFGSRYALRTDLLHDLLTAPELLVAAIESPEANDVVLHYEDLVQSPGSSIARLCQRLGIVYQPEMIEYGATPQTQWTFGDQSTVYAEQRPVSSRAERWQTTLRPGAPWNELSCAYLTALGRATVERMGYQYAGLATALGVVDNEQRRAPNLLETAIVTASYGESCDYLSQLTHFQNLLHRLATAAKPASQAASGQ